jgi:hypothetical protein
MLNIDNALGGVNTSYIGFPDIKIVLVPQNRLVEADYAS